jgi:hypothetical protein
MLSKSPRWFSLPPRDGKREESAADGQTRIISTAIAFLLFGMAAVAFAQHEQQGGERGKSEQGQQQPAQPAQPQGKPPAASKPTQPPQGKPQQSYGGVYHGGVKPNGPAYRGAHQSGVPQHQEQVRSGLGQSRAASWNNDHRTWGQRGGYNGYRVPQDRFGLYFGSSHYFRIGGLPMVFVGGFPRFQYDGYYVTFVDPWPETWPATWYQTDDVYIDYTDDGYYVYDRSRPGSGIAVTIAFY